jgi:acyl-CoA synthetase (AMP-forming)/AMP-acid ligase II
MIDAPDSVGSAGLTDLGSALDSLASELPDAPAVTCGDVTLSRAELSSRSNRVARRLAALGVGPGSMVTIALPNSLGFYETTIAVWKLGAVPQPGDMGRFDGDGYLYLSDRRADMILVGGANVYPAEIEAALDEHPAVMSSCVVGLPDEDLGNAVHAIVETREQVSDDELRQHLATRLVGYKLPRTIERGLEPLRDDAGKVRRSALREARLPVVERRSSEA